MLLPFQEPFTHGMAAEAGLSRRTMQTLLATGAVRRSVRGVYAPAGLPDDVATRARSLRLVTPPDCVVVDRHAGWLLGAEMVLAPGEHLHLRPISLFRPSGTRALRSASVTSGERNLAAGDVIEVGGLQVTTPLRTAWDLGRVKYAEQAISGLDAMLRLGIFTSEEMLDGVERFRRMRWISTLRITAPLADPRSESPGESVLRLRSVECRLHGLVPQYELWDGGLFIARFDLGDPARRIAAEYDGVEWHSTPEQRRHDRDRRDQARECGWLVEAFTKDNLWGPRQDAEAKLYALARAAERRAA